MIIGLLYFSLTLWLAFYVHNHVSLDAVPRCCGYYGEGNGRIFGAISCSGAEQNVTNCDRTSFQYNHQNDVGVQCQQGQLHNFIIISCKDITVLMPSNKLMSVASYIKGIRLLFGPL